jgi:hypothetical protein
MHDPSALGPAASKTHQKTLGTAPNRIQYYNLFFFSLIFFSQGKEEILLLYYFIIVIVIIIINKFKEKKLLLSNKNHKFYLKRLKNIKTWPRQV